MHWVLATVLAALAPSAPASVFYKFRIIAETGQNGITALGTGPSINNEGKVAFIGTEAAGQTVWVSNDTAVPASINPSFLNSGITFGPSVKINDFSQVVSYDSKPSAPFAETRIRVWDATQLDAQTIVARGFGCLTVFCSFSPQFRAALANPWISNKYNAFEDVAAAGNKDGICDLNEVCIPHVVFNALDPNVNAELVTVNRVPETPQIAGDYNLRVGNVGALNLLKPAVADTGQVVVRLGRNTTDPIKLLEYNLGGSTMVELAGAASGFTALGQAPGITGDGNVVAFAGNRGEGKGIFLAIKLASGARRIVRIAGENANANNQRAELGVDGQQRALFLTDLDLDSRIGIAYTPAFDGTPDGAVVVSFIGTPNLPSRINPSTSKPFFFTDQKGLWTIRIDLNTPIRYQVCNIRPRGAPAGPTRGDDVPVAETATAPGYIKPGTNGICESDTGPRDTTLFSRSSPIPVVQVGDKIKSGATTHTVSDIGVYDPLAAADYKQDGSPRSARRGDHRVVFFAQAGTAQLIVSGEHLDSDQDGLLDHWETEGIDIDGDGVIDLNLPAMGANPNKRDLFLHFDYLADRNDGLNAPVRYDLAPGLLRQIESFYASVPAMPSGVRAGITVHIDGGPSLDVTGQPESRNMGTGALLGGARWLHSSGGGIDIVDLVAQAPTIAGVTSATLDSIKGRNQGFWNVQKGAREFAFKYLLFGNFHHALRIDTTQTDPLVWDNATPTLMIASGGRSTQLIHDNPPWNGVALGGYAVKIVAGTGAGQVRAIQSTENSNNAGPVNAFTVDYPWGIIPDATSQYLFLTTSGGDTKVSTRGDVSFGPSRDIVVTLGGWTIQAPNPYLASFFDAWKTIVHELGHTFSLMHGGTNHVNNKPAFHSLMNYAYENCGPSSAAIPDTVPPNSPLAAACPVNVYSQQTDAVYDAIDNLDMSFAMNLEVMGQAFGADPNLATLFTPPRETQTPLDVARKFGLRDVAAPAVVIAAPAGNAVVPLGSGFTVTLNVTDNVGVSAVQVSFDVNGDGVLDEATEVLPTVAQGIGVYTATIPALSGGNGVRTLYGIGIDTSQNTGVATRPISVGVAAPPVNVPNVVGQTQAAASAALVAAGLTIGTVTQQASPTVPAGVVIAQSPAAAQQVANGSAVNLVVSSGPAIGPGPAVVGFTPTTRDFGSVLVGQTATQMLTLANTGATLANLAATPTFTGDFVLNAPATTCGITLAAGASCTVGINFAPAALGPRTGTVSLSSNAPVSPATAALTGNGTVGDYTSTVGAVVTGYYETILRRSPDFGGYNYWQGEVSRLRGLGANVSEVFYAMALSFFNSPEYTNRTNTDAEYLTDLYRTFFIRVPDQGGLTYWQGQLLGGLPRLTVLNSFMFSPEFEAFMANAFGNATGSRAEVSAVLDYYRGLLGRLPDTGGFLNWRDAFRTAQCQGASAVSAQATLISRQFIESSEYVTRDQSRAAAARNAMFVSDLYNAFLKRPVDLGGFQFWTNQINSAVQSREAVRSAFVASPEFQGKVNAIIAEGCLP